MIVASNFEQARIAFEHIAALFLSDTLRDKGRWKVWDTSGESEYGAYAGSCGDPGRGCGSLQGAQSVCSLWLNLGTSDVSVDDLLTARLWADTEGDATRCGSCVWGIDLGTSVAQSAVAGYWPETGRLEAPAAFPCEPSLVEHGLSKGVGPLYVKSWG